MVFCTQSLDAWGQGKGRQTEERLGLTRASCVAAGVPGARKVQDGARRLGEVGQLGPRALLLRVHQVGQFYCRRAVPVHARRSIARPNFLPTPYTAAVSPSVINCTCTFSLRPTGPPLNPPSTFRPCFTLAKSHMHVSCSSPAPAASPRSPPAAAAAAGPPFNPSPAMHNGLMVHAFVFSNLTCTCSLPSLSSSRCRSRWTSLPRSFCCNTHRYYQLMLVSLTCTCSFSLQSSSRCSAPSRMRSGMLSSFSASPYSANAALCCDSG